MYVWVRLIVALVFLAELLAALVIYPVAIFIHFTFWGVGSFCLTFFLMSIAHLKLRHHCKRIKEEEVYEDLNFSCPCRLWKACNITF